jgi:hypothetical protein
VLFWDLTQHRVVVPYRSIEESKTFLGLLDPSKCNHWVVLILRYSSSSSSGPGAYVPDAPQPIGLLCDPCPPMISRRSHFRRQVPPRSYEAWDPSSERWNFGRECWQVILLKCRIFTCRKSAKWDRRLYFPSEGKRAEDFYFRPEESWRLRPGLNPRTWVPKRRYGITTLRCNKCQMFMISGKRHIMSGMLRYV